MTKRCVRVAVWLMLLFVVIILAGLIPVNNGFQSAPDGIEIYVTSSAVHADIVLPIESDVIDWREHFPAKCFSENTSAATHVAIGWGDRGFFLETETWDDLKLSTAAKALFWPSGTCLHVAMKSAVTANNNTRSIRVSQQQYERLVVYIQQSFRRNPDLSNVPIGSVHYSWNDAFFEARGTYHCLNTCNSWIGGALKTTGVRVGWMTPLPKTVFWYLPSDAAGK